jgi:asparagine synthase (glutamine-hydrolysing)
MTAALRHRGPDDEGYLLADSRRRWAQAYRGPDTVAGIADPPLPADPPAGADLALGHRRLSIIDLSPAGHGPMASSDGRLWITYNGEIYNYVELRAELLARGHAFRSASDTEVILAAWTEWGPEALSRFNGMWAFALWDVAAGTLFLSRDRFGVKPLVYFQQGGVFAFASEIKALRAHPALSVRPHLPTLRRFLVAGAVDAGAASFVDSVNHLPAGHLLTLEAAAGRVAVRRWYARPEGPPHGLPAADGAFRELLEDAVRIRLRSDVDVGTCLSGGLDSSSIVGLASARRLAQGEPRPRSFSVVYPVPGLDESPFVRAVVEATQVQASLETPSADELARDLPAVVQAQDEPFSSAGVYSQWRVMRMARRAGVPVLLDGQGADEVLAGYHYHYGPFLAEVAASRGTRAAVREARRAAARTRPPQSIFLGLLAYHAGRWPARWRRAVVALSATHGRVPVAMVPGAEAEGEDRHAARATLHAQLRLDLESTSLPALLRYEDRNSMAFSVEARTPFLDYRLVERAQALPAGDLIRDGWTKAILREAVKGVVPEAVRLRRDKLGFATPERSWLCALAPAVRAWLGPSARIRPLLDAPRLDRWLRGSDAGLARRPGLWRLVSSELWLRAMEGPTRVG